MLSTCGATALRGEMGLGARDKNPVGGDARGEVAGVPQLDLSRFMGSGRTG